MPRLANRFSSARRGLAPPESTPCTASQISIRSKLILFTGTLTIACIIATAVMLGWQSFNSTEEAISHLVRSTLVATRQAKEARVKEYFQMLADQLRTLASSHDIEQAMTQFDSASAHFTDEAKDPAKFEPAKKDIEAYYQTQFEKQFRAKNAGQSINVKDFIDKFDPTTILMQATYIARNPNPLGEKDLWNAANDGSGYSQFHAKVQPYYRDFIKTFGYYDLFLVDAHTGRVVYTVYKESDFGTSLKTGPWAIE